MGSSGERTFKATSRVLSRVLDGEAVLLDLGGGQYYGLDEVGTVVWTALEAGASVAELVVRVVDGQVAVSRLVDRVLLIRADVVVVVDGLTTAIRTVVDAIVDSIFVLSPFPFSRSLSLRGGDRGAEDPSSELE